jgi:hypothetical protein
MKHCFSSKEIAHIWVHKKADYGKVSGGNEHFEGDRYYSYHTCIAERRTFKGVGDIHFVSRDCYSNQTAKDLGALRRALVGCDVIGTCGVPRGYSQILPSPDATAQTKKKWVREEIERQLKRAAKESLSASRARTRKAWHLEASMAHVKTAERLAELFKVKVKIPKDLTGLVEELKEAQAKEAAAEKLRREKYEESCKEQREKWLAGDPNVCYPSSYRFSDEFGTRLRVVERKDWGDGGQTGTSEKVIQTSLGIKIDYREAQAALKWLLSHREKGWRTNGEQFKIAGYNVSSVSETGVVAGCHRVTWGEIERIAKSEGWL